MAGGIEAGRTSEQSVKPTSSETATLGPEIEVFSMLEGTAPIIDRISETVGEVLFDDDEVDQFDSFLNNANELPKMRGLLLEVYPITATGYARVIRTNGYVDDCIEGDEQALQSMGELSVHHAKLQSKSRHLLNVRYGFFYGMSLTSKESHEEALRIVTMDYKESLNPPSEGEKEQFDDIFGEHSGDRQFRQQHCGSRWENNSL